MYDVPFGNAERVIELLEAREARRAVGTGLAPCVQENGPPFFVMQRFDAHSCPSSPSSRWAQHSPVAFLPRVNADGDRRAKVAPCCGMHT